MMTKWKDELGDKLRMSACDNDIIDIDEYDKKNITWLVDE